MLAFLKKTSSRLHSRKQAEAQPACATDTSAPNSARSSVLSFDSQASDDSLQFVSARSSFVGSDDASDEDVNEEVNDDDSFSELQDDDMEGSRIYFAHRRPSEFDNAITFWDVEEEGDELSLFSSASSDDLSIFSTASSGELSVFTTASSVASDSSSLLSDDFDDGESNTLLLNGIAWNLNAAIDVSLPDPSSAESLQEEITAIVAPEPIRLGLERMEELLRMFEVMVDAVDDEASLEIVRDTMEGEYPDGKPW